MFASEYDEINFTKTRGSLSLEREVLSNHSQTEATAG